MSYQVAVPIFISLIAFLIADSEGSFLRLLAAKSMAIEDKTSIAGRLDQLGKGSEEDYENFRLAQFSLISLLITALTFLFFLQILTFASYLILCTIGSIAVVAWLELRLTARCKQRLQKIESEFPSLIEMLTLAVGAGESPVSSLKRIASRAHGHLAREIREVVRDVEDGAPFSKALDDMSRRIGSASVRRFVDSIIISLSRGTSLVETLSHNVHESRNQERMKLLNAAGKSEISMMIPVVFLILPISILFALFPSLSALNLYGT